MKAIVLGGAGAVARETTRDLAQFALHQQAVEKRITFVPGVGATPGITNLMVARAAQALDRLVVEVIGERNGKRQLRRYRNQHPPQEQWGGEAAYFKNVGIPLSVGAQLIAGGQVESHGVLAPELALPVDPFFDQLARRGITVEETVESLS